MSVTDRINIRVSTNTDSTDRYYYSSDNSLSARIKVRGGPDQRIRMR